MGWFKSIFTLTTLNNTIIQKLEKEVSSPSCTLSLEKTSINVGDSVKGTIHDGALTFCEVYSQKDGVWKKEYESSTYINDGNCCCGDCVGW